ncbi:TPA: hypothetical protein NG558_004595 [Vibrio parahaemolyticus]|uniref:hypothetical protein n=1 Tax=Vibrio parahaemolyticus TaxID=670 RepID=UPI00280798E2|nr:hypothetical protein [Vibrio parahaemolyticus]HCE3304392.1 hypothetical protein [Vibrio parahaemolyticus]HCH6003573.1 hypothetical protein [Vibrio parahaemolyticus]
MKGTDNQRYVVKSGDLPDCYPTHLHEAQFWENLGRVVASFGFLEEVLAKAIFAFTATQEHSEDKIEAEFEKWLPTLERALSDPLGGLIDTYGKAVRTNSNATIVNLNDLLSDLREASKLRNVLCHGSWRAPDENCASVPFFVNRQKQRFDTSIDVAFLKQAQRHISDLICAIINSVTHMGWQFPGTGGPGKEVWSK